MNSSSSVLRCRAAEPCQLPFRAAAAQPAPVQAGALKLGDSASQRDHPHTSGLWLSPVCLLALCTFLSLCSLSLTQELIPLRSHSHSVSDWASSSSGKTHENKRASAAVGYCLRRSFLWASSAFVMLLGSVACS